jgi:dihydrofolate reductase
MAIVVVDVSVSLDGFMAGPDIREDVPMGDGGEALHAWMEARGPRGQVDREAFAAMQANIGAAVVGRRTFELGLEPWGGTPWAGVPTFVATHRSRDPLVAANGGTFEFTGLDDAVRRARAVAGDAVVEVLGGDVSRQLLEAGQVDELRLRIVPILLGAGTRLFDGQRLALEPIGEPLLGSATHLRFRVGPAVTR